VTISRAQAVPSDTHVRVIRPSSGWRSVHLGELWEYRHLVGSLSIRDIKLRYRQTALGVIWVVLQPLLAAGIFSFVFGRVASLPSEGVPYAVFSFAGLLAWNLFNNIALRGSTSLVSNSGMLSKVYFPRLLLPVSTVVAALIDFAVALVMMFVLLAINGIGLTSNVFLLPVLILMTIMLSLGVGVISSALMVSYRDVAQVLPVGLQMLLYASPVAYSIAVVPKDIRWLYKLNPLVGILEGFRWALLGRGELGVGDFVYSAVFAFALFIGALIAFARMERRFADVI
jgi:lipopolysaccharide transport system permease protein